MYKITNITQLDELINAVNGNEYYVKELIFNSNTYLVPDGVIGWESGGTLKIVISSAEKGCSHYELLFMRVGDMNLCQRWELELSCIEFMAESVIKLSFGYYQQQSLISADCLFVKEIKQSVPKFYFDYELPVFDDEVDLS